MAAPVAGLKVQVAVCLAGASPFHCMPQLRVELCPLSAERCHPPCCCHRYSVEQAPYCWLGVLDAQGNLAKDFEVPLPGPIMMHDFGERGGGRESEKFLLLSKSGRLAALLHKRRGCSTACRCASMPPPAGLLCTAITKDYVIFYDASLVFKPEVC